MENGNYFKENDLWATRSLDLSGKWQRKTEKSMEIKLVSWCNIFTLCNGVNMFNDIFVNTFD